MARLFLYCIEKRLIMISLDDFNKASYKFQCEIVTAHAAFIMKRKQDNCKIFLYQTAEYFIEIYYSPELKKVVMMSAFDDGAGLLAYAEHLSGIEIDE